MLDKTEIVNRYNKKARCPCCGASMDSPIGISWRPYLGVQQQALFNAIKQCPEGITRMELHDRIYGSNDSKHCMQIISTMVYHVNNKIRSWGLTIKSGGGPGSKYRLLQIPYDRPQ
jgi:hypothetical protein